MRERIHTSMPRPSFHAWLEHRPEEVPDAGELALTIAQSGTAGVSRDDLARVLQVSPETLEPMLRALVMSRQVVVVKVNGQMRYPEPEDVGRSDEMPGIKYSIDVPSQEVPDKEINVFYRSRKPEAVEAVRQELEKPARDAVSWLRKKGWIDDPTRMDDFVQDVVMGMMNRTGAVQDWRSNTGFRRATAMMLARRYASQGWPSATRERTGQAVAVGMATRSGRNGGEDQFSRIRAGAGKAGEVIRRAIAALLDADTSEMGDDETAFVDALDSLNDPTKAMDALDALDRLSTRYEKSLPQVRRAVSRIQRHLDPLLGKVRAA